MCFGSGDPRVTSHHDPAIGVDIHRPCTIGAHGTRPDHLAVGAEGVVHAAVGVEAQDHRVLGGTEAHTAHYHDLVVGLYRHIPHQVEGRA